LFASKIANESRLAFPDAYVQNIRKEKKKLTNPKLWVGVFGLVLLSYLAVSHGLWLGLTSQLEVLSMVAKSLRSRI